MITSGFILSQFSPTHLRSQTQLNLDSLDRLKNTLANPNQLLADRWRHPSNRQF
jgi:hypothetical protein